MKFLRRGTGMHLLIGKKRKKLRKWRKPKGRSNKMRENRKGRAPIVSIGYKNKVENKTKIMVYNLKDLENAKKYNIVILGSVGKKNKKEILKKAVEMKVDFQNINAAKFLKKNESR
ncbi:MAG: eL32 family ribosomal protein [Candidatus Pacearchaeota archaeon]|jgi:ribosomal protein L32E